MQAERRGSACVVGTVGQDASERHIPATYSQGNGGSRSRTLWQTSTSLFKVLLVMSNATASKHCALSTTLSASSRRAVFFSKPLAH